MLVSRGVVFYLFVCLFCVCGFYCIYSAYSCKGNILQKVYSGINETKFKSTFSFGNSLGDLEPIVLPQPNLFPG